MSGADEERAYLNSLGLSSVPNKRICCKHIDEAAIRNYIRKNSKRGHCDYCDRASSVIELEELMIFIMEAVSIFYTDPANFMSYNSREGGYLGNVYDSMEILQEHFGLDFSDYNLFQDIYESFDFSVEWADELEYYDSPADTLIYSWDYFKKTTMHRSRYFFNTVAGLRSSEYKLRPYEILNEIRKHVVKYRLLKTLPAKTKIFRCRQHGLKDSSVKTAAGMTSPPEDLAIHSNRMSPAGISMFYGAFDTKTAELETINCNNKKEQYLSTVGVTTKSEIRVIDLSKLPKRPSPFDSKRRKHFYALSFLHDFVKDFTGPIIRDGKVHISYVPTQIVTEYFRYPFSDILKAGRISGVIYPSSKNKERAIVLFLDNKESLESLDFDMSNLVRKKIKYS